MTAPWPHLVAGGRLGYRAVGDPPFVLQSVGDEPCWVRVFGRPETLFVKLPSFNGDHNQVLQPNEAPFRALQNCAIVAPRANCPNNQNLNAFGAAGQIERVHRVTEWAMAQFGCRRAILLAYSGGTFVGQNAMYDRPPLYDGAVFQLMIFNFHQWYVENVAQGSDNVPKMVSCVGHAPVYGPNGEWDPDWWARSPASRVANCTGKRFAITTALSDISTYPHHGDDAVAALIAGGNIVEHVRVPGRPHQEYAGEMAAQAQAMVEALRAA